MPENKHLRFLLKLLYAALALLGLWLALRFLLPWLAPFLAALILAALLEPAVRLLAGRAHLPRWVASALCTLLLWTAILGGAGLILWRLGYELTLLLGQLPTLLSRLPALTGQLERWIYRIRIALPIPVQEFVQGALDSLLVQGNALPGRLYEWLAGLAAGMAAVLPEVFLFLFTCALATYFISASRPALLAFLARQLPESWQGPLRTGGGSLKAALLGWLRAQGLLMLITFGELAVGLLLLRVDLALVLSALIALVDALPVFGTGTVLLPWAVLTLLTGHTGLALGLLILYGVITLVRNLLEPKLVGSQVGLPPLAALVAMYVGFQAFGVAGMVLAPLLAILVKRLHDAGVLRLWRD